MSQSEKSVYFKALKELGVEFDKHYREYTTDELKEAHAAYVAAGAAEPIGDIPVPDPEPEAHPPTSEVPRETPPESQDSHPSNPVASRNPDVLAGQPLAEEDEPIRIDPDTGFVWYQEEVMKADYARPRGRRIVKYNDPGTVEQQAKVGEYTETFEVAGNRTRAAEAKITLPSYQVGIYKDPRFPFKIHVYNEQRGFDLFDVERFYGGRELVPPEVKRKYVENVLCYDMQSVIQAIESEHRRLQLAGKV
jgi:hypothetical protein